MGGVGTRPWRNADAEKTLIGQAPNKEAFRAAADAFLKDAKPQSQNGFKVELAKRCLVHTLDAAAKLA
jgi:xanthine dehydrogenase YagS FAD-binding subunit